MLGTVGDDHLFEILTRCVPLMSGMPAVADRMETRSLVFDAALQALASPDAVPADRRGRG